MEQHDSTLELTINGETVHTTATHPFYAIPAGDADALWIEASELSAGDTILAADGSVGTVDGVTVIDAPQTMYNLTVELAATYVVGTGQWVVHNADLSGIGRLQALYALMNPFGRSERLDRYVRNLVERSAEIQGLTEQTSRNSPWLQEIVFIEEGSSSYTTVLRRIRINREALLGSKQHQIRIASHELWHAELDRIGLAPQRQPPRIDYAAHEVTVERLARRGLQNYFGNKTNPRVVNDSITYEKDWLRDMCK